MAEQSAISLLQQGQDWTDELKLLLLQHNLPPEAMDLVAKISGVFPRAVAMWPNAAASPESFRSTEEDSMCTNPSKKRRTQVAPKTGTRKRADPNSCNKVVKPTIDDGFTWRKYGQKEIFSAKFPRSYFRCTHKYDERCQATRQVQQSEQHPAMFEITYFGEHTCKQAKKVSQEKEKSFKLINFNSSTSNSLQHFSSFIKHEHEEDATSNQTSSGSVTISQEPVDPNELLDLDAINPSDSFSMEFDGASIDFENLGSILSEFGCSF